MGVGRPPRRLGLTVKREGAGQEWLGMGWPDGYFRSERSILDSLLDPNAPSS